MLQCTKSPGNRSHGRIAMSQTRTEDVLETKSENYVQETSKSSGVKTQDVDVQSTINGVRKEPESTLLMKIFAAVSYFSASFLITVVNKVVLTTYNFPSYQMVCTLQFATTVLALGIGKNYGLFKFPSMDRTTFLKIHPLPLIFLGNAVTGLGGTQFVSLPMHTCLRRFAVLITMIGEVVMLGVIPSKPIQISVYMMIIGALIAASNDLTFNVEGYTLVFLNNFLTAANAIYIKRKLNGTDYGHYGLMYYCALFMLVPQVIIAWILGDFYLASDYNGWDDPVFLLNFFLACILGVVLNVTMCLCTKHNSALTTMVVGTLKNIFVTYIGMFIGGDYYFEWTNFVGINISVAGSLLYSYVTFKPQENTKSQQPVVKS